MWLSKSFIGKKWGTIKNQTSGVDTLESAAVDAIGRMGPKGFNREFDGLQFRVHRATGGHIVEVWHSSWHPREYSDDKYYHELFLVPHDKDLCEELPQIITQAMLKQGN